jgi:hypothetical protein
LTQLTFMVSLSWRVLPYNHIIWWVTSHYAKIRKVIALQLLHSQLPIFSVKCAYRSLFSKSMIYNQLLTWFCITPIWQKPVIKCAKSQSPKKSLKRLSLCMVHLFFRVCCTKEAIFSLFQKKRHTEHIKLTKLIVKEHKLSCVYDDWLFWYFMYRQKNFF